MELLGALVLQDLSNHCAALQTSGGTGAIRLALELAKALNPTGAVHVGVPGWANHVAIAQRLRLECRTFPYFDVAAQQICAQAIELQDFRQGDIYILHGPCHNPTGADLSLDQCRSVVRQINDKQGMLLIDTAYFGFGAGLQEDLSRVRELVSLADCAAVAVSCSKAFGLYGDRTGALFVKGAQAQPAVQAVLQQYARHMTSSAPRFGSDVVSHLLADPTLSAAWRRELEARRQHVQVLRHAVSKALTFWPDNNIADQSGIFSLLPLQEEQILELGQQYAVHLPTSGRVNVTALAENRIPQFVEALAQVVS